MKFKRKLFVAILFVCLFSLYLTTQRSNNDSSPLEREKGSTVKLAHPTPIFPSSHDLNAKDVHIDESPQQIAPNMIKDARNISKELKSFLKKQNAIQNDIESYCRNNSNVLPVFEKGFSSIVIDRVNHITYCPIYKSASTSWAITLLTLRGAWGESHDMNKVRSTLNKVFIKVPHQDGPKETETTTKFMIVRHPFERIVSAYRDKFEEGNKYLFYRLYGNKMVRKYRKIPRTTSQIGVINMLRTVDRNLKKTIKAPLPDNPFANPYGPTFEEFVRYIIDTKLNDDHWRPYYIQCSLCHMKYDFILRFENLASDSNLFIDYLDKADVITTRWENPTAKGMTTEQVSCEYFKKIDLDLAKQLVHKYNHDFKLFGYSPDDYLKCAKR